MRDSTYIRTFIYSSDGVIYLRMYGRSGWYSHDYSLKKLSELVETIFSLEPRRIYVFFNNDRWMLEDGENLGSPRWSC
jgi:uncharacterized protein YecE (DUF72 family)